VISRFTRIDDDFFAAGQESTQRRKGVRNVLFKRRCWEKRPEQLLPEVGQHAGINTTSKNIYGWVNMKRNGGSTWSGIYKFTKKKVAKKKSSNNSNPLHKP
jgi:hypothetical protein